MIQIGSEAGWKTPQPRSQLSHPEPLSLSVGFIFGNLIIGYLVRPTRPNDEKNLIYECGEPTIGSSWIRYNIRFYTIALVYLIFDVEVVFLFPVALVLKNMGLLALLEVLTFVTILALGLVYAWRYGNLNWVDEASDANAGEETESGVKELSLGV